MIIDFKLREKKKKKKKESPKPQKKAISTRTDHVSLSTIRKLFFFFPISDNSIWAQINHSHINAADQPIIGEIKMTLDHDPEGKTLKIIILNANVNLPE